MSAEFIPEAVKLFPFASQDSEAAELAAVAGVSHGEGST